MTYRDVGALSTAYSIIRKLADEDEISKHAEQLACDMLDEVARSLTCNRIDTTRDAPSLIGAAKIIGKLADEVDVNDCGAQLVRDELYLLHRLLTHERIVKDAAERLPSLYPDIFGPDIQVPSKQL